MSRLNVALAQLNLLVGDIAGNTQRIIDTALEAYHQSQADLVVFPELTLTSYPPEDLLLRPDLHRQIDLALARITSVIQEPAIVIGYPLYQNGSLFNACSLIHNGKIQATYCKQHLPNYGVFDEKRYFQPGKTVGIVTLKGITIGFSICEDIWVAGTAAQCRAAGAELIINLNASPYHLGKHLEREDILKAAVRESGIPIVYVNLVGGQDELVFDGASRVINSQGQITFRAPDFHEGVYTVSPLAEDVSLISQTLREPLCLEESIYQALCLGVRDYVTKNLFNGVVLGLSGGIDSALCLAIASDALGPENVEAVMMPSRYTADMSIEDAKLQAQYLGIPLHVISIEQPFESFLHCLQPIFADYPADTTEENIQARCRGVMLMAISNKKRKLVLTTGNKSEMAVGYATLYGDMAGGFAPLKDVPKTTVYKIASWLNQSRTIIPQRVIDRAPSAELAPNQKDEDSLPPYPILDAILERYIENDESPQDIVAAGFAQETVTRVIRMVVRNEYKRRQAAPGIRITRRAFGKDRRYPITSGYVE